MAEKQQCDSRLIRPGVPGIPCMPIYPIYTNWADSPVNSDFVEADRSFDPEPGSATDFRQLMLGDPQKDGLPSEWLDTCASQVGCVKRTICRLERGIHVVRFTHHLPVGTRDPRGAFHASLLD